METEGEIKEQLAMPTSYLFQVECHVRSTEGAARLQDEEATAPLGMREGGWDEVVTQPELELRCRI